MFLVYKKLYGLLSKSERKRLVFLLVLMFIGMGLETLGIGAIVPAFALMTKPEFVSQHASLQWILRLLGYPSKQQFIIDGMLILATLYLVKTLFLALLVWRQNKFAYDVHLSLSKRLFLGYLYQPWAFHLQRNSAQLINHIINEVGILINALQASIMMIAEAMILLGIIILLFMIEPIGSLVAMLALGTLMVIFQLFVRQRLTSWGKRRQHHDSLRLQHLQQGLGGTKDAKLLGRENYFLEQYCLHDIGFAKVMQKQKTLMEMPRLWLELLAVIGILILVLVMFSKGVAVNALIPILGLFAAAAFRVIPATNRILNGLQGLRYAIPSIDVLERETLLMQENKTSPSFSEMPFLKNIELTNICYSYPGSNQHILHNISLSIPRNKTIGFIGTSGSGKSTLADLILGLLTPTSGDILVDSININSNLRAWQNKIGYVSQSIFLIDDTLRKNIAFGIPEDLINDEAVWQAVLAAQLETFVTSLPDGLDTLVGEHGVRLSGGQRQRIGIARALYHDPEILVLDEATSALDVATENEVMRAVHSLHAKKTLLIIAHRLSTVAECDMLYRFDNGYLLDKGSFDDVMFRMENGVLV